MCVQEVAVMEKFQFKFEGSKEVTLVFIHTSILECFLNCLFVNCQIFVVCLLTQNFLLCVVLLCMMLLRGKQAEHIHIFI